MDQAPGPIMTIPPHTPPSKTCTARSSGAERAIPNAAAPPINPAIGVNRPASKRRPAAIATHATSAWSGGDGTSVVHASRMSASPASHLSSKRPQPGHPLGNVENNRCNGSPVSEAIPLPDRRNRQKWGPVNAPFGGCAGWSGAAEWFGLSRNPGSGCLRCGCNYR
jgi:hypothetical protein